MINVLSSSVVTIILVYSSIIYTGQITELFYAFLCLQFPQVKLRSPIRTQGYLLSLKFLQTKVVRCMV